VHNLLVELSRNLNQVLIIPSRQQAQDKRRRLGNGFKNSLILVFSIKLLSRFVQKDTFLLVLLMPQNTKLS